MPVKVTPLVQAAQPALPWYVQSGGATFLLDASQSYGPRVLVTGGGPDAFSKITCSYDQGGASFPSLVLQTSLLHRVCQETQANVFKCSAAA
jgi:hypothetical protein